MAVAVARLWDGFGARFPGSWSQPREGLNGACRHRHAVFRGAPGGLPERRSRPRGEPGGSHGPRRGRACCASDFARNDEYATLARLAQRVVPWCVDVPRRPQPVGRCTDCGGGCAAWCHAAEPGRAADCVRGVIGETETRSAEARGRSVGERRDGPCPVPEIPEPSRAAPAPRHTCPLSSSPETGHSASPPPRTRTSVRKLPRRGGLCLRTPPSRVSGHAVRVVR